MFNHYVKEILKLTSTKNEINWTDSFYCGDAAGRKEPTKDFSADDMLFSVNMGLKFYTPEMLFLESDLNFKPIANCKIDPKYERKDEEEKKGDVSTIK